MKTIGVILSLVAVATCTVSHTAGCTLLFDGRVPPSAKPADFDKSTSVYNYQYVHGTSEHSLNVLPGADLISEQIRHGQRFSSFQMSHLPWYV